MAAKPFTPLQVSADECEGSFERMLRRFIRRVKDDGVLKEYRSRQSYRKPSEARRLRKAAPGKKTPAVSS